MESSQIMTNVQSNVILSAPASSAGSDSIFSYFWNAGVMIKIVMLVLLAASIWSWTIIISKFLKFRKLQMDTLEFENRFWSGTPLESLYRDLKEIAFDPMSNIFCSAMAEWKRFIEGTQIHDYRALRTLERRIDRAMQIAIRRESDDLEKNMGFLSSLGTNGVIIGLFGTVLGVVNGFKIMANMQDVAPILSEALFTTALGIISALPAALAYNKFMADINAYINKMETFAEEFCSIISRQFDAK